MNDNLHLVHQRSAIRCCSPFLTKWRVWDGCYLWLWTRNNTVRPTPPCPLIGDSIEWLNWLEIVAFKCHLLLSLFLSSSQIKVLRHWPAKNLLSILRRRVNGSLVLPRYSLPHTFHLLSQMWTHWLLFIILKMYLSWSPNIISPIPTVICTRRQQPLINGIFDEKEEPLTMREESFGGIEA